MAIRISKPDAQLPRNAFDLSQRHVFSSRVGLKLPVLAIDCVPGDYHEINLLSLTRTMPVKTDAFTALKQNFSFVFVPYQQIWRFWNDFINQSQEHFSTYEGVVGQQNYFTPFNHSAVPHFNLRKLIYALHDLYIAITMTSQGGTVRYLNSSLSSSGRYSINFYKLIDGCLRLLDLLGYGAYYDYVYNNVVDNTAFDDSFPDSSPNMFRICAYQKAWFDFDRNSIYDQGNLTSFNLDYLTNQNNNGEYSLDEFEGEVHELVHTGWEYWQGDERIFDSIAPFILHEAQWQRDKFTSMYPNPQFGTLSEVSLEGINITTNGSPLRIESTKVSNTTPNLYISSDASSLPLSDRSSWTINNAFSVYELRYAQMLQKWKEDKMRAGNRTKDIAKAIFGETPKYAMDQYSDFVDGFSDYINISEVVSTSQTDGASLGDIAGKGVGAGNHTVKFNTSDYGVLLCLYDVTPNVEYDAFMLDKQNQMVEFSNFFNPYFMDQGFEPITVSELANTKKLGSTGTINPNGVLGYAPHDQCYKQSVSKVHGEFMSGRTLSHWVVPRSNLVARIRNSNASLLYAEDMYVQPSDVDNIFFSQDSAAYGDNLFYQEYDQLINNFNFEIKSVRNMSVLGLPRW